MYWSLCICPFPLVPPSPPCSQGKKGLCCYQTNPSICTLDPIVLLPSHGFCLCFNPSFCITCFASLLHYSLQHTDLLKYLQKKPKKQKIPSLTTHCLLVPFLCSSLDKIPWSPHSIKWIFKTVKSNHPTAGQSFSFPTILGVKFLVFI